eukprot:XP_764772.1 hypothetical protein [Theileria parva strain Muguga]
MIQFHLRCWNQLRMHELTSKESLYVTQLKRSRPQSTVSIDVKEVERLMTPKDSTKKHIAKKSKKEESVGKLVCEGSNYS